MHDYYGRDPPIYVNQGQHVSNGGAINNYGPHTTNHYYYHPEPLQELNKHCSPSAAFNSKVRFDPPRCTPNTRCAIIRKLEEWINNDGCDAVPSSLFWLYGGAGVGKSSLAQTIAENSQQNGKLAASFFFFRNDPSRSNGDHLIPSFVSDFIKSFEGIRPFVEENIRTNPGLFEKTYEVQLLKLLIEPLHRLSIIDFDESKTHDALEFRPRVVVIDGLDECQKPKIQSELLRAFASAIPHIPYPLRFFVTSRPESHLTHIFRTNVDLRRVISVSSYNLSNDPYADIDIRAYLEAEFEQIRQVHPLKDSLPPHWPHPKVVDSLVTRSSGHFIYASTVIKYIQPHNQMAHERLQGILGLLGGTEDQPYDQLDKLYWFIFNGLKSSKQVDIHAVLGILHLKSQHSGLFTEEWSSRSNYRIIEDLLKWKRHHLLVLFDPLLSLVSVDEDLRIFHKSLFDYLIDETRSGDQHLSLAPAHAAAATFVVTRRLVNKDCIPTKEDFKNFAYHAQLAVKPDEQLKRYLIRYSQDVLHHHRFLLANIEKHPDHFFVSSLAYSLRTLSYQGSHLARQCLQRYGQMLRRKFYPEGSSKCDHQVVGYNDVKDELDSLLGEWCPIGFVPLKVNQPNRNNLAAIQEEQAIFSIYATASLYPDEKAISSLISGQHFTHVYYTCTGGQTHFEPRFLILFTYQPEAHNPICCSTFGRPSGSHKVIEAVREHLNRAGKEFGYPETMVTGDV